MRFFLIICWLIQGFTAYSQTFLLTGEVSDGATAELLAGAVVSIEGTKLAVACDVNGVFQLQVKPGTYTLVVTYLGYTPIQQKVTVNGHTNVKIKVVATQQQLKEVKIISDKRTGITSAQASTAGTLNLSQKEIKQLPSLAGEHDVIKVMQLMPGIKRGGDGSSSMYVRGGGNDQNLILLDEAVVYNPSHALGLFSVFNTDALEEVQFTKGPFHPKYSGRLSSVMEVKTRTGNFNTHEAEVSASTLSARVSVGGPVAKGRIAYQLGYRRSYLDQTLRLAGRNLPYYFQDVNLKLSARINAKQILSFTTYHGNDVLKATNEELPSNTGDLLNAGTNFSNTAMALNWKYAHKQVQLHQTIHHSRYQYGVDGSFAGNRLHLGSGIRDIGYKARAEFITGKNTFGIGGGLTSHTFLPYKAKSITENGNLTDTTSTAIRTAEYQTHLSFNRQFNSKWLLQTGVVLSGALGKGWSFINPEPRVSVAYETRQHHLIKAGYARMVQYMHLISSSSFSMPTDVWFAADNNLKPAMADHYTLGYYVTSGKQEQWSWSMESYYKQMKHVTEFLEGKGSSVVMPAVEDVAQGSGRAYGIELMAQKTKGKLTGWVAYTWAKATRNFDSINSGETFYARYDRRHDVSINTNYQINSHLSVNAVWVFSSGSRFTPRTGHYYISEPGSGDFVEIPVYGKTNSAQFATTHRLDMGLSWHKKGTKIKYTEWQIGCYNVYNRAQPYRVLTSKNNNGSYTYAQLGLLGFVPYISYQIKF